jgi:hypothetical protein
MAHDSEHNSDVDMHITDDVDLLYGIDLNGDVDMEMDSDTKEEENEVEKDEKEEDEEDEEDEDEDNGKEPWTIGQGEIINTNRLAI